MEGGKREFTSEEARDDGSGQEAEASREPEMGSPSATTSSTETDSVTQAEKPRRRGGRKRKLPKMNNSERGKYYRQKYREYEQNLVDAVDHLRYQVRVLEEQCGWQNQGQQTQFDHHLTQANVPMASVQRLVRDYLTAIVQRALTRRDFERWKDVLSECQNPAALIMQRVLMRWQQALLHHPLVVFELQSFQVTGSHEAPILVTTGLYCAQYSANEVAAMFPQPTKRERHLQEQLKNLRVNYPVRSQFFFSMDGELDQSSVEVDHIHGLFHALEDLDLALTCYDAVQSLSVTIAPTSNETQRPCAAAASSSSISAATMLATLADTSFAAEKALSTRNPMSLKYIL